jgi:hypothetical protein
LSDNADGSGDLQPLEDLTTNAAGAQIVNTVGPIREIVQGGADAPRRYLVICIRVVDEPGAAPFKYRFPNPAFATRRRSRPSSP